MLRPEEKPGSRESSVPILKFALEGLRFFFLAGQFFFGETPARYFCRKRRCALVLFCVRFLWRWEGDYGWVAKGDGGIDGALAGAGHDLILTESDGAVGDGGVGGEAVEAAQRRGNRPGFGRRGGLIDRVDGAAARRMIFRRRRQC